MALTTSDNKTGFSPKERAFQDMLAKAAVGDIVFHCYPATVSTPHRTTAWTRTVRIRLEDAAGNLHSWFSGSIANGVSIADTGGGTASIPSTTLTFVNGEAVVVISGTAATWAAGETDTLTVAQATIMGATVAAKTSVETFTS